MYIATRKGNLVFGVEVFLIFLIVVVVVVLVLVVVEVCVTVDQLHNKISAHHLQ